MTQSNRPGSQNLADLLVVLRRLCPDSKTDAPGLVCSGIVRFAPLQRSLTPEEIAALFIEFRSRRPIFSRMIARIPGWKIDSTYDEFLRLAQGLRGVAFRPRSES